jgi:hypothetical protein
MRPITHIPHDRRAIAAITLLVLLGLAIGVAFFIVLTRSFVAP